MPRSPAYLFFMPPIHPDFVHFPLALLTVAFLADIIGFSLQRPMVRAFAWGCLVLGFIGLLAAILSGWIDMSRASLQHETHELVDLHWRVGVVLAIVTGGLIVWRARLRRAGVAAHPGVYLVCFAAVFALTIFQGWFGGELAYAHGAGVAATGQGMVSREQAARRIQPAVRALRHLPGFAEHEAHGPTAGQSEPMEK